MFRLTNEEASSEKIDVKRLRNKFESLDKPTDPVSPPPVPPPIKKRVSIPANSVVITNGKSSSSTIYSSLHFLSGLSAKLNVNTRIGTTGKPPVPLPKARSISPPPAADELTMRSKVIVPQIRLSHNSRHSVDESDTPSPSPSPLPSSFVEPSIVFDNVIDDRPISVQSVRAYAFDCIHTKVEYNYSIIWV